MKPWIVVFSIVLLFGLGAGGYYVLQRTSRIATLSPIAKIIEKPLDKYTIENLGKRVSQAGAIVLDEAVATTSAYTVYQFHFTSGGKKVTGLAHIPQSATETKKAPVIVQFRGYVDRETYQTGEGTRRSGEVYARNGFISLAPDFLGYGKSDMPEGTIFEERFLTYTTALDMLSVVSSMPMADPARIGIWGHSNGGQIALTVLEATQKAYPTVLWAPVSKPFPYSILYYTDELSDRGKLIRRELASFEKDYDVEMYSLPNYVTRIKGALQLHQGGRDEAVPQKWSDEFAKLLEDSAKDLTYHVYPESDHNMVGSWNTVVSRDIEFFRRHLK